MSDSDPLFIRQYWLSYVLLLAATLTLGVLGYLFYRGQLFEYPLIFILPILLMGIFRAFASGSPLIIVFWPLVEIFLQLRFLWQANNRWPQVMTDEKGHPRRAG